MGDLVPGIVADIRRACWLFVRRPGLLVAVVVTMALGIGANTAIFAVARSVLLRPLPYGSPERLVMLWRTNRDGSGRPRGLATSTHVMGWRARNTVLTDIAALDLWQTSSAARMDLVGPDGAEQLRGSYATRNFFRVVGVQAVFGRTFRDDDADDVVVLSDALWRRRFGADPDVVGTTVDLTAGDPNRELGRFTIIGVLPARFRFTYPQETELWAPLGADDLSTASLALRYTVVARLKAGVTYDDSQTDMAAVAEAIGRDEGGRFATGTVRVEPVHEYALGRTRPALLLLGAVTSFLLIVACLNIASVLTAHMLARRYELAVRAAVGATRLRLVRQLVTESLLLTAIGGLAGIALAWGLAPILRASIPATIPRFDEIGVDLVTLGWAVAMSALTGAVVCLIPAWRGSGVAAQPVLQQGGPGSSAGVPAMRWGGMLTALQVGLVFVLLAGGGMLLRSFWNLQRVDLGFNGERVLTAELNLLDMRYRDPQQSRAFNDELLARVRSLPGVIQAGVSSSVPLRGTDYMSLIDVPGSEERLLVNRRLIDPQYFTVMGIPLRAGRPFEDADTVSSRPVVIVSETLARRMFPEESAVGQVPNLALGGGRAEIVGVVGDVRHKSVDAASDPAYYLPRTQATTRLVCLVVHTLPGARNVPRDIRSIVRSIDPRQPIQGMTTLDRIISDSIADRGFYAVATAAFAVLALLLAGAGLYGVVTRSVAARVREFGIRMATGATPGDVIRLVLRRSLWQVGIGIVLGACVAYWLAGLLQVFLFEVEGIDAPAYAVAAVLILVASAVACFVPARRASRLDPMVALRFE